MAEKAAKEVTAIMAKTPAKMLTLIGVVLPPKKAPSARKTHTPKMEKSIIPSVRVPAIIRPPQVRYSPIHL